MLSLPVPVQREVTAALNIYSRQEKAFDQSAVDLALTFAAYAAVALACSADEAFNLLVRLSQQSNRKLREVADALVESATGGAASDRGAAVSG